MGHFICDHDYHDWDYWDFGAEYLRPSDRKRRKRDKLISPLRCQYCHPGLCLPAAAEIGKIITILKFYFHSPPHHPHHSYHPHHHHSHPHNPHHDNDQCVLYYLDNRRLKCTEDSSCTTIMISVFLVYFHPHQW